MPHRRGKGYSGWASTGKELETKRQKAFSGLQLREATKVTLFNVWSLANAHLQICCKLNPRVCRCRLSGELISAAL